MKEEIKKKIKILLNGYESYQIEYKLCKEKLSKDIWETVSAFSNTKGGIILLGYKKTKDKYIPVGLKNPSKILDDFTSTVSQKFNFCPIVHAEIVKDEGKKVIIIEVKEAPRHQKPIYDKNSGPLKGGYKRVGATDVRLNDQDIHRFYLERLGAPDAQFIEGTTLEDIDPNTIAVFRALRRQLKPDAPELNFSDAELLRSYNLII